MEGGETVRRASEQESESGGSSRRASEPESESGVSMSGNFPNEV